MKKLLNRILSMLLKKSDGKLPSYADCVKMCERKDSPFYEVKTSVDGFPVSLFNYRLAANSDFDSAKSREMRGICFVFNLDGSLYKRYILLEKFFNMNQTPATLYNVVKNYEIKFVNNKEDGSIASFIKLPNGKIVAKSKMSFTSEQAFGMNRVLNSNSIIRKFVEEMIDRDIVPIFEYVAPFNRIVLKYAKEDLILLKLRDNKTGKHLDLNDFNLDGLNVANFENNFNNLDDIISYVNGAVDKEGVIVQSVDSNGDDFFFKLKTPWYVELHGLLTEDVYRENRLISLVLDERIDDILGQIPDDDYELREKIYKIINLVKSEIKVKESAILNMWNEFESLNRNKKEYALRFLNGNENAALALQLLKGKNAFELAKNSFKESTKKLSSARNWLSGKDNTLLFNEIEID